MTDQKYQYLCLYATVWIILLNLLISNRMLHLLLLPLIIFGNYLIITKYQQTMSFYGASLNFLILINVIFHILLPIYIIQKERLVYKFDISAGKKNLKYLVPILVLLAIYVILTPINTIYFIDKKPFFMSATLLFIIGCFFLKSNN
jgi:hypothetical protein